jgi:c-di-GMP-binding flagellar brake protein YcgR
MGQTMKISFLDKLLRALFSSKKERRREPRRKDELPIEMEVLSSQGSVPHTSVLYAQIKNISPGGVKILSSVVLPSNTSIKLKITLPESAKSIEPVGRVVWVTKSGGGEVYEMGIEFQHTPPHILSTLLEYVYTDWK